MENKELTILDWPAQSPDLNPIENLWSILDDLAKDRNPNNDEECFRCIKEAWERFPDYNMQSLVDSMPRRLDMVIKHNGYPTKY